ncbi:hypothetical protein INQ45_01930 [Flavobacterium columnare]|nr:hypothetical protein [Flavobacterium columnare]MEB3799884.1 hypothetical protein [Flavobacterium columnare]
MNTIQILKNMSVFLNYDYDICIKKSSYPDEYQIRHIQEFTRFTYNPIQNVLSFRDERENEWIYTGNMSVKYFYKEYDFELSILSGSTLYGNNKTIKHTQTAEEIFHLAFFYFAKFIRTTVDIPIIFPKMIYQGPPIDLFSPICEYRYQNPILVLYTEASLNFLGYCVKIINKDNLVSFSESYSNGYAVSFVDEKRNKWMYTDRDKLNFAIIKEEGYDLGSYERGCKYYDEKNDTYTLFTNTKEEVYQKAFLYFSSFIKHKKHRKYRLKAFELSNN